VVSDNITVQHVLNVKRVAYETRSAPRGGREHGRAGGPRKGVLALLDARTAAAP
jgi:hypothetical protein